MSPHSPIHPFTALPRTIALTGYLCALAAGALWGTTGPLSTALYAEGAQLTDVGFWRVLLATIAFAIIGLLVRRDIFHIERRPLLLVIGLGGVLVALFEVAFQYAIAGVGVAGAVVLLYTAPVMIAVLARVLLHESLTVARVAGEAGWHILRCLRSPGLNHLRSSR